MTTRAAFDAFCAALPGSVMVVQWGGSHVHKIGAKMFAIGGGFAETYIFKASPMSFALLRESGLARRAPYLPRGNWLVVEADALPEEELFTHIAISYRLVSARLTRAERARLGLD